MKEKVFAVIFLIVLSFSCTKERKTNNDLSELSLYGKVRSVRIASYNAYDSYGEIIKGEKLERDGFYDYFLRFNEVGYITEKTYYDLLGQIIEKELYKYDNKWNASELITYNLNGELDKKSIYKYNDKGKLVEYCTYNPDGTLRKKNVYKPDAKGNLTEFLSFLSDGNIFKKEFYKYDDKNNLIEENHFTLNGAHLAVSSRHPETYVLYNTATFRPVHPDQDMCEFSKKITYEYNEAGNIIDKNEYNSDGSLSINIKYDYDNKGRRIEVNQYLFGNLLPLGHLKYKTTFKYDDRGNQSEECRYEPDGSIKCIMKYKYDNEGNLVEEGKYNLDGTLDYIVVSMFEFDNNKNWTRVIMLENDFAYQIDEREIEYY